MFKKYGIPSIITLVVGAIYYYVALPPLHIKSGAFWSALFVLAAVWVVAFLALGKKLRFDPEKVKVKLLQEEKPRLGKTAKRLILAGLGVAFVAFLVIGISSFRLFNAPKYQSMLQVNESDFAADISEIPFSQIPVVDKDTAERLGSRKIGEVVELVSQFDVSEYYTQINYREQPVRVSPLAYADILKWFVNRSEGIPYYVRIDMASQSTDLVELEQGMRYSPSEFFGRDLLRHVRFAYPTKMFEETSFEIDDNGHPYWIVSYYDYTIGFLGGRDIAGIICVDAVTGTMTDYKVSEIPQWIDRVYSSDLVLKQAEYWGTLKNGFWNSIFVQKNVVRTTEGYNYLAINDDVWLYTGITSVVSDNSNIGFLLINMRTKEGKTYTINGAEEYSAMESAQGVVQEKRYTATFPILLNVNDTPSYFISLKDNAGLVKAYSFVSVSNYQIVGVGDTIEGARSEYLRLLANAGLVDNTTSSIDQAQTVSGQITALSTAVVEGNSMYYLQIDGKVYKAPITAGDILPFVAVGDTLTLTIDSKGNVLSVVK